MKRKRVLAVLLVMIAVMLATTIIITVVINSMNLIESNDKHKPIMSYETYTVSVGKQTNEAYTPNAVNDRSIVSNGSLTSNNSSILKNSVNSSSSSFVSSISSISSPQSSVSSQNSASSSASYTASSKTNNENNSTHQNETTQQNQQPMENHEHNYSKHIISPTCTSRGYALYTCDCGNSYAEDYQKALGHSWSDWETLSEPTITSKGLEQRSCSRCSSKDYRYINELKRDNSSYSEFAKKVVELVNIERKNNGLSSLKIDDTLMKDSYTRSKELEINFRHQRPNGESGYQFALNLGYSTVGENIAAGQNTPEAVVESWMNSSGHRANILNPDFTNIGVGCYTANDGWIYWTQLFGG